MRGRFEASFLVTAVTLTLSCAPVDEVPSPDAEKQARIVQLAAVLRAIGEGRPPSVDALSERFESLCRFPPAASASRHLAQTLIDGLSSTHLPSTASEHVAADIYALMNGGYLTRDRLERVTLDLQHELIGAGMTAAAGAAVRDAAIRAAREPRDARTDWW